MRQDVDIGLAKFLSQEMAENSKRAELSSLLEEVDDLEAEVHAHSCARAPPCAGLSAVAYIHAHILSPPSNQKLVIVDDLPHLFIIVDHATMHTGVS